jgi:hypothetical protein
VAVAVGLFLFYAWCSPRTIALEDDGLFVMASYFNGIAHPPGYPVFTLIGHLFSQLPFGSVAWRVHLVSALFGGLTCAVIWCIARSLVPSRAIATASALAYGFSEVFWSQAIIAEVYTLNTFITFLVVFMLLEMTFATGCRTRREQDCRAGTWFRVRHRLKQPLAVAGAFQSSLPTPRLAGHWPVAAPVHGAIRRPGARIAAVPLALPALAYGSGDQFLRTAGGVVGVLPVRES